MLLRADDDDAVPSLVGAVGSFTSFLPLDGDLVGGYTVLLGEDLGYGTGTLLS